MLTPLKILFFIILQIIFVQCLIPSLTLRKVDQKMLDRKRQDTLEMCRIFNAENKQKSAAVRRSKRSADAPDAKSLKAENLAKVEKIVDKLYDDQAENGQEVKYRRRNITDKSLNEKPSAKGSRRFNFAPYIMTANLNNERDPDNEFRDNITVVPNDWFKNWKHGIVPYFIDPKTYDAQLQQVVVAAFDYFEKTTCIRMQRLREKPIDRKSLSEVEWVYISNPSGIRQCVHSNERIKNKGVQMVIFGYECMSQGEIVHEVMHILGFPHEHTRHNRDQHISIVWDNIKPGYKKYFEIKQYKDENYCTAEAPNDKECLFYNMPYDVSSVMHYPARAFSKNGQATIKAKDEVRIGQRVGLSAMDVQKIALVYDAECLERNKIYLEATCPIVNEGKPDDAPDTSDDLEDEIKQYYKDRIWSYGRIIFKYRDPVEFSIEEKDYIRMAITHISRTTCIDFQHFSDTEGAGDPIEDDNNGSTSSDNNENNLPAVTKDKTEFVSDVTKSGAERLTGETADVPDYGDGSDKTQGLSASQPRRVNDSPVEVTTGKQIIMIDDHVGKDVNKSESINTIDGEVPHEKARMKRSADSPAPNARRHANKVLVLTRSSTPGCKCPEPGVNGHSDPSSVPHSIELSVDCFNSVNDLVHVFMHVIGFDHQHNSHDRDKFIHIEWDKISEDFQADMKEKLPRAASVGFPYDYQSIMHFPWLQIKSGVRSMMFPIWNDGWSMGHWTGLSSTDIKKVNKVYEQQCELRNKLEDDRVLEIAMYKKLQGERKPADKQTRFET